MRSEMWDRIARLEARLPHRGPNESDARHARFKMAVMSIIAFHAGEWTSRDSFAVALTRGLQISGQQLKSALSASVGDSVDLWALVLEKLNDLAVARGGHTMFENGSWALEGSDEDDGLDSLDQLYSEVPDALKERHQLLPHLANYFV